MKETFYLFQKSAIAIGITVLLPFLVHLGFILWYPSNTHPRFAQTITQEERDLAIGQWKELEKKRTATFFWISLIIGSFALVIGILSNIGFLGSGFILGGIATQLVGLFAYWNFFEGYVQFFALLFIFILLVAGGFFLAFQSKKNS